MQPQNKPTLIGAIQALGDEHGASRQQLTNAMNMMLQSSPTRWAVSDPREEVLIRFTVGSGEWDKDMKYNVLRMKMFNMDGTPDGSHDGVWEPQMPPSELTKVPAKPKEPYDEPKGPVPETKPRAYTKAIWRFGAEEKDSITAVGPAILHLVPLVDGSHIFTVAVSAVITNGSGRFAGCRGVKTALGSTFVPPGVNMFELPPGTRFGAVTVETFRVIYASNVA